MFLKNDMLIKRLFNILLISRMIVALAFAVVILLPGESYATQLHSSSEGIITHQIGHLFFLFSMAALVFTIIGKGLDKQQGWRFIQYAAIFFIMWNIGAFAAHFFDNQINIVKIEHIAPYKIKMVTNNDSSILAWIYYALKLDHLLCVPAMFFLYKGLSSLVRAQKQLPENQDTP